MKKCNWTLVWFTWTAVAWAAACSTPARGQARPFSGPDVQIIYQRLLGQINQIPAFDNHGHPGFPEDSDVDAMAISPDSSLPFRLRQNNPEMAEAAKALFGYPYGDLSPEHLRWLVQKKAEEKKRLGNSYFSHVLDLVGIQTVVANRVAMPDYLAPTRFRWVFFVDSFLFPFDNRQLASRNPDHKLNLPLQEKVLQRNIVRAHFEHLPADLNSYLSFITRILEENQKAGGVAIKFEIAYFRSLHFDDPSQERATAIYTKHHYSYAKQAGCICPYRFTRR
jgi:hypothetical protein